MNDFVLSLKYFRTMNAILDDYVFYSGLSKFCAVGSFESNLALAIFENSGHISDVEISLFFPAIINLFNPSVFDGKYLIERYHFYENEYLKNFNDYSFLLED